MKLDDNIVRLTSFFTVQFKSPWMDLSLHQMPKFQSPDGSLLQTVLPRRSEKEPEMKLNPKEDVKISMVFAGSKLVIPLILLFDSKHKRSLKSLTVTFSHDDFDITKLEYETVCKFLISLP